MLKIEVNKKDAVPSYRSLGTNETIVASFVPNDNDNTVSNGEIELSGFSVGGMNVGDRIRFVRKDCKGNVVFIDTAAITNVSDVAIRIKPFPDIRLDGAKVKLGVKKAPNGSTINVLEISGKHCFIDIPGVGDDADSCYVDIKENVIGNYTDYDKNKRRCKGDYFLYESCFLYQQPTEVREEEKYTFDGIIRNKSNVRVKLLNEEVVKRFTGSGDNWETDSDGFIWLKNCVIPVGVEGKNEINKIIWEGSVLTGPVGMAMPSEDGEYKNGATVFACENERYYSISGNEVTLLPNVEIFFEESYIKINGALEKAFDINLFQRDALQKKFFFEKNKIIDFEKQIFYPVYGNSLKDALSITYKIFFRQRTGVSQPTDEASLAEYEEGIKKWKITENGGWNVSNVQDCPYGDLIGFAGFTDDDIYYQKKKVGMSFLRLSLYDTKDRLTQSLLGYSTMFLDSTALYKRYVLKKNSAASSTEKNKFIVFRTDEPQLGINFSCANKYNSDKSSEGFYLYLFPSLLETQPESTEHEGWKKVYLKAEFNNAKYGKTVPFTTTKKDGYVKEEEEGKPYIDMNALFSDMYMTIEIKYDIASKRYVWRFPDKNDADIVINLFEPKVNG